MRCEVYVPAIKTSSSVRKETFCPVISLRRGELENYFDLGGWLLVRRKLLLSIQVIQHKDALVVV
jgi:hypothetical protein